MSRRSFFLTVGFFLLGLGALAIVLALMLRYECRWYNQAYLPPGLQRQQLLRAFVSTLFKLHSSGQEGGRWGATFTDAQINSYLQEGLIQSGFDTLTLPEKITQPRLIFDEDRVHLGFRYGRGLFSTVITIDLRVWLVPKEQNVIALEVEGFRAGALPITTKSLLEKVAEVARGKGVSVNWYRDKGTGHAVAILRFQEDQPRPTFLLEEVKLERGALTIHGCGGSDSPPGPVPPNANLGPNGSN